MNLKKIKDAENFSFESLQEEVPDLTKEKMHSFIEEMTSKGYSSISTNLGFVQIIFDRNNLDGLAYVKSICGVFEVDEELDVSSSRYVILEVAEKKILGSDFFRSLNALVHHVYWSDYNG